MPEKAFMSVQDLGASSKHSDDLLVCRHIYSGLTLNQDKATKPQTVQIVRQGEATPYWFKVNPLYFHLFLRGWDMVG